jgi:hypothetical protein
MSYPRARQVRADTFISQIPTKVRNVPQEFDGLRVPASDPDGLNRVLVGQPARLVDMLGQEVEHQRSDFIDLLVEREMTCIEEADFGVGEVALIGFGAGRDE